MKVAKPKIATTTASKFRGLVFAGLLAVILVALFWKSFLPGYVHFSNDGPLAQQNAAWARLPAAFTGIWGDLNDIGNSGGSSTPDLCTLLRWLIGPVGYSKFLAPFALFILGLGAWTFFRQLKFSPLTAILGGLAATLNSAFFSTACWGVASQQVAIGFDFFALALIVSNSPETPRLTRWVRWMLAGLCVGANVMQGADIGAIFSLFIAAFVLVKTLVEESGPVAFKLVRSAGRVGVIAIFAGFLALQMVVSLVGTSISGIAGTAQDAETKARQWNFATQWSEPKIETLGIFVPGLFGYKMNTPDNVDWFQDAYRGGAYWGSIGRDAAWTQYFASDMKGPAPDSRNFFIRQTGGGPYVGMLVALIAAWVVAQSFRRQNSAFALSPRKMIWFWFAILVFSLLMSFGKHGFLGGYPYRLFYELPYGSLIRNPTKFILVFSWATVVLFAYGMEGFSRRYLVTSGSNIKSSISQLQSWWKNSLGFDRKWTWGCIIALAACVLAWLVYAAQKPALVKYLQLEQAPGNQEEIAAFSIRQAGWFLLLFALAIGLVLLIIAGIFSGKRARLGGILLGLLLVLDLGRGDLPWIVHWNYLEKYSSNPIVDILRDKPYEHRVVDLRSETLFEQLYGIEWVQQLFPYYNIQSLDLVMRPRVGSDLELYESAFMPTSPDKVPLVARHWQLTNARYFLGPAGFLDSLNQQLDPVQRRFQIAERFNLLPKPGVFIPAGYSAEQVVNYLPLEEITAQPSPDGVYALFDFTGALPRAKLYSNWQVLANDKTAVVALTVANLGTNGWALLQQVGTNDFLTLNELVSLSFDPWQTVLLADSIPVPNPPAAATNQNAGAVECTSYTPTDIKFHTQAATPTVLLLNDQYDAHWNVTVDGKSAPLLRANFIMRGVYLPAGEHSVGFRFRLPVKPLYVTLAAMTVGILLCGFLFVLTRNSNTPPQKIVSA